MPVGISGVIIEAHQPGDKSVFLTQVYGIAFKHLCKAGGELSGYSVAATLSPEPQTLNPKPKP